MRTMYVILCSLGWIWTLFAFAYLAVRLRKQSKTNTFSPQMDTDEHR